MFPTKFSGYDVSYPLPNTSFILASVNPREATDPVNVVSKLNTKEIVVLYVYTIYS